MRDGYGELRYKNGSVYQGNWQKGMKWGQGKMTYSSGNFYEGNWEQNKRNGQGTMNWVTSNEKYTGNWIDNMQSGFGTHIWLDSSSAYKLLRNRYVGYWENGLRHGKGTFYYSNGSKYEGDWHENFKQGHGKFTFEDGTEYDGPFEKDRMVNRVIPIRPASPPPKKGQGDQHSPKTRASLAAKKEVEANPFKRLLDISDLIEFEQSPADAEKEVQNIMLRYNSELKNWYNKYARKVEATKSEESFAMTLRQVWRFLRDCQVPAYDASLAQFNRIYNQGKKNHFTLLGPNDVGKFNLMYGLNGQSSGNDHIREIMENIDNDNDFCVEDESQTRKDDESLIKQLEIEMEDVHGPTKVVLQRQFFEAIVRAAFVKYRNCGDLPSLADKLDHMFKANLVPNAIKTKAKSSEEEKNFKLAENVMDEYAA